MTEDTFDIRSEQQAPPSTDREFENALRPLSFDDFTGQTKVVDNLQRTGGGLQTYFRPGARQAR